MSGDDSGQLCIFPINLEALERIKGRILKELGDALVVIKEREAPARGYLQGKEKVSVIDFQVKEMESLEAIRKLFFSILKEELPCDPEHHRGLMADYVLEPPITWLLERHMEPAEKK